MTAVTIHGWQRPHRRIRRRSLCAAFAVALPLLTALAPAAEAQTRAAKPTGFTATAGPGSGQVTLSWDDPSNSAITSYSYRVRTGSTFGSWASIPDSDADTTTYTVTGLTNGTEYGFRIRADIGTTLGQASSIRTATPVAPVTVAFAAGSAAVTVAEGDDSHAELTLELSAARSAATQVRLISNDETATGGSDFTAGPYTVNFPAGDTRATLRIAITDENVPEDSETFAVAIVRVPDGVSVGTPSGATVTIRDDDKPPPAPTGLTATSGAGSVTLAWSYAPHAPPAVDRTAHFQYRRGTGDPVFWGAWTLIPGSGAGTRSHTVAGLADGTEYAFQVRARARAVGGFRPGTSSDTARATPLGGLADKVRAWAAESACADECVADWKRALKALGETDSDLAAIEPMAFGEALTRAYTPGGAHRARWIEVATELLTLEVERVVVTIAASPAGPVAEGARVTFTLTLAAARSVQFDIFVNVADAPGSDFLAAADEGRRRVTLPVGETTAEFTVRTVADSADEPDGAVTATVLPVQDVYTVGSPASAQAAVSDDDEEEVEVDPMPAKPEGFTATAGPGSGQVTLSWDDPDNSAITRYSYRVRTGGAFGPWALIPGSDADTTTYTVTGLTNGTEYGFRIRADIGTTLGQASSIQTATPADPMPSTPVDPPPATPTDPPPATPVDPMPSTPVDPMPAKPEGFTATAGPGSGQVTLSWDDPGNSAITSYSYRVRTGGAFGPWALIPGSDADTTTYTVTGLTNGTEYGFRIRADIGTTLGQASSIQTATPADPMPSTPVDPPPATPTDPPPATPVDPMPSTPVDPMPAKPEGFTATAGPGSGQVTLSWDDPDNSAITRYSYRVRTGGAFGPWALIPGSDADTTTYTVTGLTNGTEYGFRIRADIGTTLGQASSIQTATPADPMPSTPVDPPPATPTDPPPATPVDPMPSTPVDPMPAKPEGFTATAGPGSGQVTLSWDDPDNSAITRYSYRVRTGGAFGPWALIPGSDADTTTYTVTGLTNGTEYGFRIRADIGTTLGQASSIQTATPATVAAPNTAPTVAAAIQDQAAAAGAAFSYTFPEDAFSDADGDPLAYAAARGDGGALPAWLRFDASARAFSGTPGAVDSGVLAVRVTASDGKGGSASAAFNIVVAALPTVSVAAGPAVAEGGEALFTITVDPEPDGGIMVAAEASAAGNFVAAADLGGRSVTLSASRPSATISVATIDDDADEPDGAVTLTLIPSSGIYTIGGPASASVAVSDNDDPSLEVSESSLSLEEGASASYTVALEAAPRGAVAVSIAVSDGAGVEVSPTSLSFTAATWNMPQSVTVTALEDDDIDDESGSLIHAASGGGYDGVSAQVAVMVADDDEPSAAAAGAWMPRFGRVASEQIIEGIGDRVASRRSRAAMRPENAGNGDVGASFEAVFAGRGLGAYGSFLGGSPGGGFADGEQGMFAGGSDAGGNHASRGFPVLDAGGGSAGGGSLGSVVPLAAPGPSGTLAPSTGRGARSLGGLLRGALASSSFNAGGSTASGADWGLWGRGSMAALEGRSAMGAAVDGDVATGQVGADWSAGRWLFGISASYSRGDGDYADAGGGGSMESSMAALTPYAGVDAGRLSAWGAFGAGWGDMTLAPERGAAVKAGIDMRLGAAGFRGELMDFGDGFSLSLVSDAMAARSASDAADGLPEAEAEASRVRAAVEASWTRSLADGTRFSARLEGGVRMDGGAAEDGLGGEVSAGLSWLRCGLAVEIEGRRLVAHEDDDFAQTGVSAHLDWEVCGAGGLGPSASLRQRWGIATASGLEQLFAMRRMGRLGLEPDASGLDAELGWGVALPGGRFLGTPFMLHGTQARGSLQTLGWRIEPLGPDGGAADAGMALKLVRRAAGIVGRNDHGILLEARLGF